MTPTPHDITSAEKVTADVVYQIRETCVVMEDGECAQQYVLSFDEAQKAVAALIESQLATIERVERERDGLQNSVNALDQERDGFAQLNAKLKADNKEMGAAFDARWGASRRATERWRAANPGNALVWPDGADLIVWCLDQVTSAEARVTALEAEKAAAVKLADGYGIVLMMIAAGCSEPQRFAKRMLAEYAPEAKKMEATK